MSSIDSSDSLSPYSMMRLQHPQSGFKLQSNTTALENINPLRESETDVSPKGPENSLRLASAGGGLSETLGSGLKTSVQEQILINYTNGAALVTKASFMKAGLLV